MLGLPDDGMVRPVDRIRLQPLLSSEIRERRRPIPFRFGNKAALIDHRYKLLTDNLERGEFQLYDLEADPREANDLSASQPDVFARLKQHLLAWNETVEASFGGRDYSAGRVTPPDPEPQSWYDTPASQPYLPAWQDRWEFKSYLERGDKPKKAAKAKR